MCPHTLGGSILNKLVRNEQRKLTTAFINGVAIAILGVGVLAQAASMVQTTIVELRITAFVLICIPAALALHVGARAVLKGMEE
jgi:hypothetical protein